MQELQHTAGLAATTSAGVAGSLCPQRGCQLLPVQAWPAALARALQLPPLQPALLVLACID